MRVAAAVVSVIVGTALLGPTSPLPAQVVQDSLQRPFSAAQAGSGPTSRKTDETRPPPPLVHPPDPYKPYQARLPARPPVGSKDVVASLTARGFVDVTDVRQRGGTFLAEATGPRGERVRIVVDAASGEISGMQVIGFGGPR